MASLVIATRKSIYNTPSKLYNAPKILQEKMIMRLNDYFKNKTVIKRGLKSLILALLANIHSNSFY